VEELLGRVPGKKGLERRTDGRKTRREWRLTGTQTVADSVLAGGKKSAAKAKTPCGCRQKVCDWRQNRRQSGDMNKTKKQDMSYSSSHHNYPICLHHNSLRMRDIMV